MLPLKSTGEELNRNERKLYKSTQKYFFKNKVDKWSVPQYYKYEERKGGKKLQVNVRKEIFEMHLDHQLQNGAFTATKYLKLKNESKVAQLSPPVQQKDLIIAGRSPNNYINGSDYIRKDLPDQTKNLLRLEMEKDISTSDEAGFIYMFTIVNSQNKSKQYFKIGRGKDVEKRLKQWEKKCSYNANLLEKFKCKYTHRVERLIHLELSNIKVSLPPCSGCKEIHKEWFDGGLISNTKGSGLKAIKKVIQNWITFCDQVYGPA
ncbi:hypothetical protein C2G38_2221945 [Gigaspora rosea]|uniref:Bacteriophage T5 Orf172 DNA-binding domain-containing protein n=1 Tax=Gigaspora rosea TaxID=44941 RepID=A0A397U2V3_9GLOM|nr:hypothetical protein C2G38_2221945 [Gigaspora rosea]CAG8470088.1 5053_t:CDS:2 [Gigaspora rosea]CAG8470109.1 5054_t:CDS:2 [Gigaspora rosea]